MRVSPLPVELGPGPFSTAQARLLGVPTVRLGRGDLVHPTRGANALAEPATLVERAAAFQVAMPGNRAFSHLTAAVVWGLPLPRGIESEVSRSDAPLHVIAPTSDGHAQRPGVVGHRGLELRCVATPPGTGLRTVDVADTWCDLGELPRGVLTLTDLVVVGDAAVAILDGRAGGSVGVARLHEALRRRNRPRGAVALRQALTLVRTGVRSPMESRARLMFLTAGFPEPEVNAPLTDAAGEWLAEGDLVWRRHRVVGECQGEDHADRRRRSTDSFRRTLVEDNDCRGRGEGSGGGCGCGAGLRAPVGSRGMGLFNRDRCEGKTPEQLAGMRTAGLLVGRTLELLVASVRPGLTTLDLDTLAESHIRDHGGIPNFQLVPGYRHTLCTSVNEEIVHGIPGSRVLEGGDLVSIDCGAQVGLWNGDAAVSLVVGGRDAARREDLELVEDTEASLWAGIAALRVGESLYAVGAAVEDSLTDAGQRRGREYGIVEDYVGHGIGTSMHMDPQVPNYRVSGKGPSVVEGTTICIEPMVALGDQDNVVLDDEWTVVTRDRSRAAHWEHSVAATAAGLCVLTALDGGAARLATLGVSHAPIDPA